MANPSRGYPNGAPAGANPSAQAPAQEQPAFTRPFTLFEALPYSPFSSIIPFQPDIIPTPTLGSVTLASKLSEAVPKETYDALNEEAADRAAHPGSASKQLDQSLEHIQHYLNPNRVTKYTFKTRPNTSSSSRPSASIAASLSPLAKMVYENASISYRYPTPETPDATSPNGEPTPPTPRLPPSPVRHKTQRSPAVRKADRPKSRSSTVNSQPHAHNSARFEIMDTDPPRLDSGAAAPVARIDEDIQMKDIRTTPPIKPENPGDAATITPSKLIVPPAANTPRGSIAIELSHNPGFKKEEYMVVPDEPELPTHLSIRKQRHDEYGDSQDIYNMGLDQRQRANAAFQELRQCCQEIFEAEESLLSGGPPTQQIVVMTGDDEPTLTVIGHSKLQPLLQKAIELNCFLQVPIDDLLHIQKLCEGALKVVEDADLRVEQSWGTSDVATWLAQLPRVDTALKAARTCLRVMAGGREDKQLYSEDLIQSSVDLLKNVKNDIIVPISELRNTESTKELFRLLQPNKKAIANVYTSFQRLFYIMASLVSTMDLSETVVNSLEVASSELIFVENSHTEKDSVAGVQKFDGIRLVAMDMLSQIFLRNPSQRQSIFDGILTSLEKLPVGKLSARQYKLADGRSIQPVSALIMRLLQASASKVDDSKFHNRTRMLQSLEEDGGEPGIDNGAEGQAAFSEATATINSEERAADQPSTAISELQQVTTPLVEIANRNVSYVTTFMVNRALNSTKSGDSPFRNLLDLFVEDFTACLESPEWPAAELILRRLTFAMIRLIEGEKSAATAKNMALDLLGAMEASIAKLRSFVRSSATALDATEHSELGTFLADLASWSLENRQRPEEMVSWSGPYRAALEYLQEKISEDPHLASAVSLLVSEWASRTLAAHDACEDDQQRDQEFGRLAYRLRMMILDSRWLSSEYSFAAVTPSLAKLSYAITLVPSQFCGSYNRILGILLRSMSSDQPTVRSKSLKSVNQVLDTDPTILDGDSVVIQLILNCSTDPSPQVRDSALTLMGKCISISPSLEEQIIPTVIERLKDSGVGVRKRAMRLAKDIYLGNHSKSVRSTIANGLLPRVHDLDDGVKDIARQMIEEIWIHPFVTGEGAAYQTSVADHVALMVQTVKQGNVTGVLDKIFETILRPGAKSTGDAFKACKTLVASIFDLINNPESDDPSMPSGRDALHLLTIFAKADPKLFTFEQVRLLKPHISSFNFANSDELAVYKAVVVIYRRVLPHLSSVHTQFFAEIMQHLLPAVAKIPKYLLDDVMACLWILRSSQEQEERLARLVKSSFRGLQKLRLKNSRLNEMETRQFQRYALLIGMAGKHFDLDEHLESFKEIFPTFKGTSVSKLMVDVMVPFAQPAQALSVRKDALEAVGLICQSWPRNYVSVNVYTTFQQVFRDQIPSLEDMILGSFKEFLVTEEHRSEQAAEESNSNETDGEKRSLKVMGGTNYDDVASATTQRFLNDVTRIALASQDDHALLAVEVLASITRQGLVHPKETGVTLITLETSPVTHIAEMAHAEHRALHNKHEAVLEREYVKAIQSAFLYQRDIVNDPHGATTDPFTAKLSLMMEVLKMSRSKNRTKFLQKVVSLADFEPAKLDVSEELPQHVHFSRFVVENLAFIEYLTIGELQATVATMEKLVTATGATVAHAIESDVFQVRMDAEPGSQSVDEHGFQPGPSQPISNPGQLRQLTAGAMILQSMWEARTFLRRLYNLGTSSREAKGKSKDLTKAPVKVQGVTGDKFWEEVDTIMSALSSQDRMMQQCRAFVELMNVDKEFKIADEDEELDGEDPQTPSNDEDDGTGERGRKRKNSSTPGNRKKRARSTSQPRKRGRPRKNPLPDEDADGEFDDMDWA